MNSYTILFEQEDDLRFLRLSSLNRRVGVKGVATESRKSSPYS